MNNNQDHLPVTKAKQIWQQKVYKWAVEMREQKAHGLWPAADRDAKWKGKGSCPWEWVKYLDVRQRNVRWGNLWGNRPRKCEWTVWWNVWGTFGSPYRIRRLHVQLLWFVITWLTHGHKQIWTAFDQLYY